MVQAAKSSTGAANVAAAAAAAAVAPSAVVPVKPPEEVHWDIEAAVEFIEGNQSVQKDSKKAEKKARQKQKKVGRDFGVFSCVCSRGQGLAFLRDGIVGK